MKTRKKTILFVEDNRLVFSIYRTWLQRYGFKVEGANDGEIALNQLPLLRPHLVILDYMMPKLNGLEVLKFIRSHSEFKKTPVLFLSNAFLDEQALKDLSPGLNRQLHKSRCTPKLLVQSVRELLGLVPPPEWQSESFPPPAGSDEPADRQPPACVNGQGFQKCFARIREESLAFAKEAGSPAGADHLKNLYQHVQFMCVHAGSQGSMRIAHLTGALEAMLREMSLNKSSPTRSGLQTITQTVDCLDRLIQNGDLNSAVADSAARVLIVDDDPICNFAARAAMKRAKLEAVSTPDPQAALAMARTGHYDVILLDINMPGMNGFELCGKLRVLPQYKRTPVIFVTANDEFQNRAQAVLSGGNDLIAKPICPQELALKTIMRLTESLEQPADETSAQTAASPAAEPVVLKMARQIEPSENKAPVPLKNGQAGAAPNGDEPQAPAAKDILNLAPYYSPPRDAEFRESLHSVREPLPARRNGSSDNIGNHKKSVKDRNGDGPFDKTVRAVTRILFGDHALTGMSLHLTRSALERCHVPEIINHTPNAAVRGNGSRPAGSREDPVRLIAREVARIVFGDEDISETHLRLARFALERYDVQEIISPGSSSKGPVNGAKSAADELKTIRKEIEDIKATLATHPQGAGFARANGTDHGSDLAHDALSARLATAA